MENYDHNKEIALDSRHICNTCLVLSTQTGKQMTTISGKEQKTVNQNQEKILTF